MYLMGELANVIEIARDGMDVSENFGHEQGKEEVHCLDNS